MPLGINIGYMKLGPGEPPSAHANDYDLVIASHDNIATIATLPGRTLAYMYGPSAGNSNFYGIDIAWCRANNMLLLDALGNEIVNLSGSWLRMGKIGEAAYQSRWAADTMAWITANAPGLDGIFIDDCVAQKEGIMTDYPPLYPNQAAWENAVVSFLDGVGTILKANGYYVCANSIAWGGADDQVQKMKNYWTRVAPHVSGLMHENYITTGSTGCNLDGLRRLGPEWCNLWDGYNSLVAHAESAGVDFIGISYGLALEVREQRYVRGSFLLEKTRPGSTFIWFEDDNQLDPWSEETTMNIGTPLGPKVAEGSKWRRTGTLGNILVDPINADATFTAAAAPPPDPPVIPPSPSPYPYPHYLVEVDAEITIFVNEEN